MAPRQKSFLANAVGASVSEAGALRFMFSLWDHGAGGVSQYLYSSNGGKWGFGVRTQGRNFSDRWRRVLLPPRIQSWELPRDVRLMSTASGKTKHQLSIYVWQIPIPFLIDFGFETPARCESGTLERLGLFPKDKFSLAQMNAKTRKVLEADQPRWHCQ
jgi:hypothetical protein